MHVVSLWGIISTEKTRATLIVLVNFLPAIPDLKSSRR